MSEVVAPMTDANPLASASSAALSPAASASTASWLSRCVLATYTLWWREIVRFLRQRSRVIGALGVPVVFWLLLGSGLNDTFTTATTATTLVADSADAAASEGVGYLAYFFPGTIVMIVLFTAIFSTISVIEDRREGFLQGVLVSPAPRLAIALGKVLGGATLAFVQAALFLLAWPFVVGVAPGLLDVACVLAATALMGVMLTALGLAIAWPMRSTAGFHAIMNLLLMPMWFLSGSLFPLATAPPWMQAVMYANPLTYGHALLASHMQVGPAPMPTAIAWPVAVVVAVLMLVWVTRVVGRPSKTGS